MQKHTKNYIEHFNLDGLSISCENCGKVAVDVHHIVPRSKFGKKMKHLQDLVENLIGLCRTCHEKAHFRAKPYLTKTDLHTIHNANLGKNQQ